MKLNRRQLRRLIESALYENYANNAEMTDAIGADEGEYESEKEANKRRNEQIIAEALAYIFSPLLFMKNGKVTPEDKSTTGKIANAINDFTGYSGSERDIANPSVYRNMDASERLTYVEKRLKQLEKEYTEASTVFDQKIGLLYMKKNPGILRGYIGDSTGEQKNLGDFLVAKVGYKNLKKYPTLYRIYQASV